MLILDGDADIRFTRSMCGRSRHSWDTRLQVLRGGDVGMPESLVAEPVEFLEAS